MSRDGLKMKMRKCESCEVYTLKAECPRCGGPTKNPRPPSFSPQDKYGKWRRIAKIKEKSNEMD